MFSHVRRYSLSLHCVRENNVLTQTITRSWNLLDSIAYLADVAISLCVFRRPLGGKTINSSLDTFNRLLCSEKKRHWQPYPRAEVNYVLINMQFVES